MCVCVCVCACLVETLLTNHHLIPHISLNNCLFSGRMKSWTLRRKSPQRRKRCRLGVKNPTLVTLAICYYTYISILVIISRPLALWPRSILLGSIFHIQFLFYYDLCQNPMANDSQALRHALLRAELRLKALRQRAVSAQDSSQRDVSASPQDGFPGKSEPEGRNQNKKAPKRRKLF